MLSQAVDDVLMTVQGCGGNSGRSVRLLRDGDEIKSTSGRSRVRQNAGLHREFQARALANAATNAGFIYARFLSNSNGVLNDYETRVHDAYSDVSWR